MPARSAPQLNGSRRSRRRAAAQQPAAAHAVREEARAQVRPVEPRDLDQITAIDAAVTGVAKTDYWYELLHRYGPRGRQQRFFLVAERDDRIQGFVVGEVRDWEFGSPPCGWVFGITVRPDARLGGIGTRLLEAITESFRRAGVTKIRTLLARDNHLIMAFFRSQGMMAAPFIALERDLQP
jgi:ribosomal protein S18 acetylase RimI-like enzyme